MITGGEDVCRSGGLTTNIAWWEGPANPCQCAVLAELFYNVLLFMYMFVVYLLQHYSCYLKT